jgi:hypothetical protein
MQRYTIFFITVNAVHVSGGFSAHHQELKNCTYSIRYMSSLLAAIGLSSPYKEFPSACSKNKLIIKLLKENIFTNKASRSPST